MDDGGPSSGSRPCRAGLLRARSEAPAPARQCAPAPHDGHGRGPRGRLPRLGGQPDRQGGGAADRPPARLGLTTARPGAASGAFAQEPARPRTDRALGCLRALRFASQRAGGAKARRTTRRSEHAGEPGSHLDLPLRHPERAHLSTRSSTPDRAPRPTAPHLGAPVRPTRGTSPPHKPGPARSGLVRDPIRGALSR